MDKIRILLADDHTILRESLRALLEREPDLSVVGEAADGRAAVTLACQLTPEVTYSKKSPTDRSVGDV